MFNETPLPPVVQPSIFHDKTIFAHFSLFRWGVLSVLHGDPWFTGEDNIFGLLIGRIILLDENNRERRIVTA